MWRQAREDLRGKNDLFQPTRAYFEWRLRGRVNRLRNCQVVSSLGSSGSFDSANRRDTLVRKLVIDSASSYSASKSRRETSSQTTSQHQAIECGFAFAAPILPTIVKRTERYAFNFTPVVTDRRRAIVRTGRPTFDFELVQSPVTFSRAKSATSASGDRQSRPPVVWYRKVTDLVKLPHKLSA
jgi:hypothetical protein